MSSEAKAREWWILFRRWDVLVLDTKEEILEAVPKPVNPAVNLVHVQEVTPTTLHAKEMRELLAAQNRAIDTLFAMLILRDESFKPSEAGRIWKTTEDAQALLSKISAAEAGGEK
jgi:hypothetical protein